MDQAVFTDDHVDKSQVERVVGCAHFAILDAHIHWTDSLRKATTTADESCPPSHVLDSPNLATDEALQDIILTNPLKERLLSHDIQALREIISNVKD